MAKDETPSFLAVTGVPVLVGRASEATLRIQHPSISRRHATVTREGDGLIVEDHDSRFGTFVNGARIRRATLRPGDRVLFGSVIAYKLKADGLWQDGPAGGMELEAVALTIFAPPDLSPPPWFSVQAEAGLAPVANASRGQRPLVEGISFHVRPDAFVGILGPSGAGKSTILNGLASYLVPGLGRLYFDGSRDVAVEFDAYRALLGHVPQDDVVFRPLTVRENLHYAARLRLDAAATAAEIASAIGEALERVGLVEHADKPAAILSGGQRKRLSVAIELLRRPRLLLLDEPTSGLDPASEARLMEQLRHVTRRGTTVICTTHLMDNLRLLDEVIVLGIFDGTGRLAYAGPPDGLLPHFQCRGFADLYEILDSGRFAPVEPARGVPDPLDSTATTPAQGALTIGAGAPGSRPHTATPPPAQGPGTGLLLADLATEAPGHQLLTVAERALRLVVRDRGLVVTLLAQPVILALVVCLTQYELGKTFSLLFLFVVVAIWLGLNNAARDLVRERRQYVRDRLAGLRPGAYLGAKATVHVVVGVVQVLALLMTLHALGPRLVAEGTADDIRMTSNIGLFLVLLACHLGGVGIGLLVSALLRTEETAVAALPLLILPQLLLSAVATGTQDVPYTSPRPFRPLIVTVAGGEPLERPALLVDVLSMACLSRPAALLAEGKDVAPYSRWIRLADLCHLLILLFGTWTLAIVAFQRGERRWIRTIGLG
jgi:ABC-type multidrug transport system ATPase subunit